jgi:radical SAM superfamily enzyme YgiQ (UPF0313 family)
MVHQLQIARLGGRVSVKVSAASVSLGLPGSEVYSFDRAGRLYAAHQAGIGYRRSLRGEVFEIRAGIRGRRHRALDQGEGERLQEEARETAALVAEAARAVPRGRALAEALAPAAAFDAAGRRLSEAAFAAAYPRPVSILPPDRYLSVAVQVTEGCPYNRCSFCDFYRDRPYRLRSGEELGAHLRAVLEAFGEGLSLRRGVFLCDANAVAAPRAELLPLLEKVRAVLGPSGHAADLASFVDALGGRRKTREEWRELRRLGLRRVYIGLESGDEMLARLLRKAGTPGDARRAAADLKAEGISVAVIVLAGLAEGEWGERHERATAELLDAMELGRGDLVYLSPFVDRPGTEYGEIARRAGLPVAGERGASEQMDRIREGMRSLGRPDSPKAVVYDIRAFVY